jgi:hypothetical protein
MPDISSYKINTAPDPSDILIGTDVTNGQTKNFSIQSLSVAAINNFLKHTTWQFIIQDPDPDPRPEGTISFENYGGQSTPWSSITSLYINVNMPSTSPVALSYLQRLVGYDIVIQDVRSLGRYGVYTLNSLTLIGSSVYEMNLTYVTGSSTIQALQYYSIQIDEIEGFDSHFEFTQGVPATTWDITHNLNKFPSITVVDTASTTVVGSYEYINKNRVILSFSGPFAGKAFLN